MSVTILHKPGAQTPPLTAEAQSWEHKGGLQDKDPPGGCPGDALPQLGKLPGPTPQLSPAD